MKHVSLEGLLKEVGNLGGVLGPAEYAIISDSFLLLKGQFPTVDSDKISYITRNSQLQSDLLNLASRVSYINSMKGNEKVAYWGGVLDYYEGSAKDKESRAMNQDSQYRDLCDTIDALKITQTLIDNLLWSLKLLLQKV